MKYIVIVPDGMWDEPCEELSRRTPLEAARTVNMDFLAAHGMIGRVRTIPDGMYPGSDIGNMALLGYDPRAYHTGRAPLEAASLNIELAEDEIAFRANLVTEQDGLMVDYSAGHITTDEAHELVEALNGEIDQPDARFYTGKSYRHILILRTTNAEGVLNATTTAPHDIMGQATESFVPSGAPSERLRTLMKMSHRVLRDHPVNRARLDRGERPATGVWLWGQGRKPKLPSFHEKYGARGSVISAVDLVHGIGKLAGLESVDVPGINGYYDTNYAGKAEYAIAALEKKDFVFIHIEAPDEAGHNGDARAKMECIEKIDREIVGRVLDGYGKHPSARVLVLPDHPTPVSLRTHTADPVGFVMYGSGIPHNGSTQYSEVSCARTDVLIPSGEALLSSFMK